ncbi:MAG: hypothetical protein J6V68_00505 [Clostridia bacterium]|nr:hypothetical protein [Clostridia bacterium]
MKRIIKLISTILFLIFIFNLVACSTCLSCEKQRRLNLYSYLDEIPLEITGYKLVKNGAPMKGININKEFVFNGITYCVRIKELTGTIPNYTIERSYYDYVLTVYEKGKEDNKKIINNEFLIENSYSASQMAEAYKKQGRMEVFAPIGIVEFDNRLFIFCQGIDTIGGYETLNYHKWTPAVIFEYDIVNNAIKYAGYGRLEGESRNYHMAIAKVEGD